MTCAGNGHTHASILFSEDIDIWVIAQNMGHKGIKQITETYGHLIKEKDETENQRIHPFLQSIYKPKNADKATFFSYITCRLPCLG